MHTLYEQVVIELLAESKIDSFTRMVTQKLIRACKKVMDKVNKQGGINMKYLQSWPAFMKRQDWFGTPEGRRERSRALGTDPNAPPAMTVQLMIYLLNKPAPVDKVGISGGWSPIKDLLSIKIFVDSTTGIMKPQHLSMIQQQSYEVIRHEFEHSVQSDEKLLGGIQASQDLMSIPDSVWNSPRTFARYMLSDAEKEAFVAGFYHLAKRTRRPFIKVIDEHLDELATAAVKKGCDAVEIRNVLVQVRYEWLEYAKKRFPKAIIGM